MDALEVVTCSPIPHVDGAVIRCRRGEEIDGVSEPLPGLPWDTTEEFKVICFFFSTQDHLDIQCTLILTLFYSDIWIYGHRFTVDFCFPSNSNSICLQYYTLVLAMLLQGFALNVTIRLYPDSEHPLPPDTRTPSELTASVLMMALWPERFWMKFPSGNFHCLMLSGEPEANVYLQEKITGI